MFVINRKLVLILKIIIKWQYNNRFERGKSFINLKNHLNTPVYGTIIRSENYVDQL